MVGKRPWWSDSRGSSGEMRPRLFPEESLQDEQPDPELPGHCADAVVAKELLLHPVGARQPLEAPWDKVTFIPFPWGMLCHPQWGS